MLLATENQTEPMTVKVGDRVLYGKYAGSELKLDGKDYLIVRESDLLEFLDSILLSAISNQQRLLMFF